MKVLNQENIIDYKVEDFAHLIGRKIYSYERLINKLNMFDLEDDQKEILETRVRYAKERVEESLTVKEGLLFCLIPFGVVFGNMAFAKTNFINIDEENKLGFYKRVKEFYMYSFIGVLFYFIIIMMFILVK